MQSGGAHSPPSPRRWSSSGNRGVFCNGTILFRSADTLVHVNGFLLRELGVQYLDSAPWACNHASLSSSDEAVLMARMADYSLILGTDRDVIIFHKFGLFY